MGVGGFLDVGADGGEQQQVDLARFEGRSGQDAADGAGGEIAGPVPVGGDDAFFQPVQAGQQARRHPDTRAVLAQPVLDGLRVLTARGQMGGNLGDTAVDHAVPFPAPTRAADLRGRPVTACLARSDSHRGDTLWSGTRTRASRPTV